jgi:hypothetical protein
MMPRLILSLLFAVLSLAASAQPEGTPKFQLRAIYHNPLAPFAELYVPGAGDLQPLNLSLEGISEPQEVSLAKGILRLYSSAEIDPENPLANLAAQGTVPAGATRIIIVLFPSPADSKPPYRMMILPDDVKSFPKGESRVLNATGLKLAMKAGEHSLQLAPGKVVSVPQVKSVNDLNRAPTAFYQQGEQKNDWNLFAERPMQFAETCRNIILIYQMPNVALPQLRTLVDTDLR